MRPRRPDRHPRPCRAPPVRSERRRAASTLCRSRMSCFLRPAAPLVFKVEGARIPDLREEPRLVCPRQEVKGRVLDRVSVHVRHGKNARSPDGLARGRDQGNAGWAIPTANLGKDIAHRGCFEPDLRHTGDIRFHFHLNGFGLVPQLLQIRMCEVQCVGAGAQMVQLESSFGIRFRLGAGSPYVDARVRQSNSQRVDDRPGRRRFPQLSREFPRRR